MNGWPGGQHLAEIYDALYSSLGAGAAGVTTDAFVVRMHETSRTFGALALEMRGDDEATFEPLVVALMNNSLAEDPTGALTLYAVAMEIGPRLLVSLRDYLEVESDEHRRRLLTHGSDLVVREIGAVGATLARGAPFDDPAWADAARALADALDVAGMAESLGQRV